MMHRLFSIFIHSVWHQIRRQQHNSIAPCCPAVTLNHVHRSSALRDAARSARAGALLALFSGSVAWAQAADPSDIAEGGRLFRQKANCQACHGWAGDGRKMDTQMPDGANLRETKLDRQDLVMVIKCGRPGTGMPAFDRFAYSDGRCYGLKQADLRAPGQRMPDPPSTLQVREVETIVDFLVAKVVKQGPMDHAKCIEFWGSEVEACDEFPK
jgi:Cytochrome C oxidase, cbb3-type, subunit III